MRLGVRWSLGLVGALMAAACSGEAEPGVELARVADGEVTEVVAAPATIEPRARTVVPAPLGGEVVEVLVDDGQQVAAGDPVMRLSSDALDLQIAQAEAAATAAGALTAAGPAVDLTPLFEAVRGQLDAVVPDVLDTLEEQVGELEDEELRARAEQRLDRATANYAESRQQLLDAEQQARATADQATAAQRTAAEAQRRQAEAALDAARRQQDELTIVAPASGVVELGDVGGGASALPGGDVAAEGLPEEAGGIAGLFGSGGTGEGSGPLAAGASVSFGQTVAEIFDLSGFHARADVDELDAVSVEQGQPVTVLVDAFPDAELAGEVGRVAIAPTRGGSGGVVFPVEVELGQMPANVDLRVGLTSSVEIAVEQVAGTVVPSAALLRRGGQEVVYVARDGVAREVAVEVLAIGDDTAAVEGAVEPGDQVVTVGVEELVDGDPIP